MMKTASTAGQMVNMYVDVIHTMIMLCEIYLRAFKLR